MKIDKNNASNYVNDVAINLLNSNITGYQVAKEIDMSESQISRLRNDIIKLENVNWSTVQLLFNFAIKMGIK